VLDPDSYTKLVDDREMLKAKGIKVGFLGARTNMSSLHMNVRNRLTDDQWNGMKWLSVRRLWCRCSGLLPYLHQ
jgi:hypothetical protein